ncbi:MAG: hypothetical protein H8K04_17890 [Nitrospira sp.]
MSGTVGTLEQLAGELALVFEPLARRAEEGTLDELLPSLGLRSFDIDAEANPLVDGLAASASAAANLEPLIDDLIQAISQDDRAAIIGSTAELLQQIHALLEAVRNMVEILRSLGTDPGLPPQQRADLAAFASVFIERLLNQLLVEYVEKRFPHIALLLITTGVIEIVHEPSVSNQSLQGPYVRRTFHLGRLAKLFTEPIVLLREVYRWGDPTFDGLVLFTTLQTLLSQKFGIPAEIIHPPGEPALLEAFGFNLEVNRSFTPPGLDLALRMPTAIDRAETIEEGDWRATFETLIRVQSDISATIRPPFDLEFHLPGGLSADFRLAAEVARSNAAAPFVVVGTAGGSRLEMQSVQTRLRLDLHFDAGGPTRAIVDPAIEFKVDRAQVVLDFSQSDGFLASIFSGKGFSFPFDIAGEWSLVRGVHLRGGAGLETTIAIHRNLFGALTVDSLYFSLQPTALNGSSGIQLVAAATATAQIGPVAATVEQVGLVGILRFPPQGGNLGVANLELGFKPPSGVGLAIQGPGVAGGGFLFFDPAKGEYGGVLQLELGERIAVKAIGLLSTRLPDGSKGYSLVLLITAEGFTPIPLGFGFTLTGIGGLLGVNRTVRTETLRQGLKTGTLDSLLFPRDPVRNAPQLVSDLRAVFPPAPGRHVLGPMVQLRWGTPTLLTLDLAVLLELPTPVRLIVLGRLQVLLPNQSHPLVQIRMDALGVLDFNEGTVALDATLYDSRILDFTLTGDMALRARWGSRPNLVLAIGGVHPRFPAPPGLPVLSRLALTLADGANLQLRCQAYLAVTSNTVQFGARVDLHAAGGGFSFDGMLSFDALVQLAPLAFQVDVAAAIALRYRGRLLMGISFSGMLAGPTPWHVEGKATIKILFFKVSVHFERQFGARTVPPLPAAVDVLALVTDALRDRRNWSATLPRTEPAIVTLHETTPAAQTLRVHPLAELTVRERVAPLKRRITKLGTAPLRGGPTTVIVTATHRSAIPQPVSTTPVQEPFALAQFEELRDDELLARPAFETHEAGLTFTPDTVAFDEDPALTGPLRYETLLLDPTRPPQPAQPGYTLSAAVVTRAAVFGAAGQAVLRRHGRARYRAAELVA